MWCSSGCYDAAHFNDFLVSSIFFVIFSTTLLPFLVLFYMNPIYQNGFWMAFILIIMIAPLTIWAPIRTYRSYTLRKKIKKYES